MQDKEISLVRNIIKAAEFLGIDVKKLGRTQFRDTLKKMGLKNTYNNDYTYFKNKAHEEQRKLKKSNYITDPCEGEVQKNKLSAIKDLYKYIKKTKSMPTFSKFKAITPMNVARLFNNMEEVEDMLKSKYSDVNTYILNESDFDYRYKESLSKEIKKYSNFIITTAVSDKPVDVYFLNSLRNYAKRNNAKILILPCEDVSNRNKKYKWNLDPELSDCGIVFEDVYLNKNFCISAIKTSARQINSITGLDRLTQKKDSSIVLAATKQFLKFIPSKKGEHPKALMTTGAVTVGDYDIDAYMSKRLSVIAESDHRLGALIVEVQDNKHFHFRQVQASRSKSITDLGTEYFPNGKIENSKDTVMVLGDSHVDMQNKTLLPEIQKTIKDLNVKTVVLHDCFNMSFGSHHEVGKACSQARKHLNNKSEIQKEGELLKEYLDKLSKDVDNVVIVKSNHDLHLNRYLDEGRFIKDPINLYFSLDLAQRLIEGIDPLKYMIEEKLNYKNKKVRWLNVDESYMKHGHELGNHGDLGANGAKGSARTFECVYGPCIVGHSHTASILRDVMTVGVTGELDMGYNVGPSSWTHSCALLFDNKTKQLINYVKKDNKYIYRKEKK